jgi:hypothetical protein
VIPNPPAAINLVHPVSPCARSHGDCSEAASRTTFGLRERSAREKANALNQETLTPKKSQAPQSLAARAFAITAIRDTLPTERPMIATRNEPVETWESAYPMPRANDPGPIITTSAVFTAPQPLAPVSIASQAPEPPASM